MKQLFIGIAFIVLFVACNQSARNDQSTDSVVSVKGLDGHEFFVPKFSESTKAKLDSNLLVAKQNFESNPSEENYIWLGRRQAYLYNYHRAIEIFSEGIRMYPQSYKLYRHRGHRYITLREFDKAVADLQQAAALMPEGPLETEPDGQPNKLNTPLSSTQFNVWYHLGLAHYLRGDLESALRAYIECKDVSVNDDLVCATNDWLYMTLRRLGLRSEAERVLEDISSDMNIIENDSYHKRLLMYKKLVSPDSVLQVSGNQDDADLALATQGYGVGNWYLYNGDTTRAINIFKQVTGGKHFSSFGFIAAETDLILLINNK
jgi:tetratricopeptide (TPR) repeat protein